MQNLNTKLKHAELICQRHGGQLTPLRLEVLALVYQAQGPISAYDLLRKLRESKPKAEPPTIYRALEFLQKYHLLHRIEKDNAYVACEHPHEQHKGYFLICNCCGNVNEIYAPVLEHAIMDAALGHDFSVENYSMEITGICRTCATPQQKT